MFGKNSLVVSPSVAWSHCCCHFSMLFCLSWCYISLFGSFFVAYVAVSTCLLGEFVCELVSIVPCVCLYPGVFYVPVFFLQCDGLLSYFFYEMVTIFLFLRKSRVFLISVCIIIFLGTFCLFLLSVLPVVLLLLPLALLDYLSIFLEVCVSFGLLICSVCIWLSLVLHSVHSCFHL